MQFLSRILAGLFFVLFASVGAWAADGSGSRFITLHDNPVPIPKSRPVLESADDDAPEKPTDVRLYDLVDLVLSYSPIPQNPFILYLADEDDTLTPTANATGYLKLKSLSNPSANQGIVSDIELERIIVFNRAYLDELLGGDTDADQDPDLSRRWSLIALVAHEIGHFLARHHDTPKHTKAEERQADWIAGSFLGRMGATKEQTLAWVKDEPEAGTSRYPPRAERLAALEAGWTHGRRQPAAIDVRRIFTGKARSVSDAFAVFHGYDLRGGDLCQTFGTISMPACSGLCLRNADCAAFSYDRRHGRCFLKRDVASVRHREGHSTSGVRRPRPAPEPAPGDIIFWEMAGTKLRYDTSGQSSDPFPLGRKGLVASNKECLNLCSASDRCNGITALAEPVAGVVPENPKSFRCLGFREPPLSVSSEEPADFAAYKIQPAPAGGGNPPECEQF